MLNSDQMKNPRELPYIVDEKLLEMLRELLMRTGAKVVLTSSWRIDPIGLYAAEYWAYPTMAFVPISPTVPARRKY